MDGTLLDGQGQLNEEFWEIEPKLADKGIKFAIASGRQYYNLADRFDSIKDKLIFIADNGSYVVYRNEQVHLDSLDKESTNKFIEIGREIKESYVIVSAKNSAYVESADERFIKEASKYFKRMEIVTDLTKVEDTVLKVTICDFNNSETNSYLHYKPFEKEYKVAVAGKLWLDISDWNANKGTAIKKMQEKFGVSHEETMVFGDYLNDIEMMRAGKYSYAMKNAHPKIIDVANYVTKLTNNENGVLATIKEFGLI
jgi:Cof subfamily protein (haloacid dehalogenase superfamily)